MQHILPVGKVFQAGTLSGNPVATAAGAATLRVLRDENPYPLLEKRSQQLAAGLIAAATKQGIPHRLQRVGSMMTFFFTQQDVSDWDTAAVRYQARRSIFLGPLGTWRVYAVQSIRSPLRFRLP